MFVHCLTVAVACSVFACGAAVGQPDDDALPRRAFFGVALGEATTEGVLVSSVLEGSTAAAMDVRPGDVIHEIDGTAVAAPADVIAAVSGRRSGDVVEIGLVRDGAPLALEAALESLPTEQMAGAVMEYRSVITSDGVRLRTIMSRPSAHDGPAPAVMLIQGGGCGSIDTPIGPPVAQPGLMHAIGAQGFVTFRVEKSGVGDSEGAPCAEIGYFEELDGYRAALVSLRAHPAVDPQRIVLLGVSLGGVFAAILANETPVAGIVTYGTIDFAPMPYPGRSDRFFAEIAGVDVLGEWARVEAPALILYGEHDETAAAAGPALAAAVNGAHPGLAEHRELAGLDHCWTRHASLAESRDRCGQGEATPALQEAILAFLRANT